jgi:hypothetical protein
MPGISKTLAENNARIAEQGNQGRGGYSKITAEAGYNVTKQENPTKAPPKANSAPKPTTTTSVGTGLIAALNNYQQQQVKLKKYNVADIYEIKFADAILASATVTPPGGLDKALTGTAIGTTAADQKLPEKQNMDASSRIRSATAGQQIVQFIDQVLRASSYILDQSAVIWNEKTNTWELNGKPASQFAWFNIVCNAEMLAYDNKRNDHAYRMTFVVTPYQVPVQSEYFKPGEFRGVHKVYNYWFTGQNTQVLQYEQHFNKLWTQAITGTNLAQTIQQQVNSREQWKKHVFPNSNQSSQGAEQKTFEPGANAADYLYSVDQAEIKLSIIGDPAWIPNPNLGYVTPTTFTAAPFYPDSTINTSASGAYFEFAWNRPVDYNLQTGLMDPGQNNAFADRQSGVAGIATEAVTYMANRVTSTFKGGKFSQELYGKWLSMKDTKTTKVADTGRPTTTPTDTQSRKSNLPPFDTGSGPNTGDNAWGGTIGQAQTSLAKGTNQILNPATVPATASDSELRASPSYINARRGGATDATALEAARSASTAGTNNYQGTALPGIRTGPQRIVKDANPG